MPRRGGREEDVPSTLARSEKHAQDTYVQTHESAVEEYGEGSRAHRTAWGAVKHSYEKVGDHWEPKKGKGPSDEQSEHGGAGRPEYESAGGVDANVAKSHLYEIAKRLDVPGRSTMRKDELVAAIEKANDRATARARE